jgi:GntR family transcriptional regulator of vanillate catabolism
MVVARRGIDPMLSMYTIGLMGTLSHSVTETLREWILHGELQPGERLEEIPLAKRLGVSRTPVRAALALLGNDGLLEHQPKRGYTVRVYKFEEVIGAYEVRSVLEGLACRRAAQRGLTDARRDELLSCLAEGDAILKCGRLRPEDHAPYQLVNIRIHNTILNAADNSWVTRFATQAQTTPFASDRIMLWDDYDIIHRSHGDHHRIVEAILGRDAARAEALMREHVYYAGIILMNNYQRLARQKTTPGAPSQVLASDAPAAT